VAHIVISTVGTIGDFFPFLGLGRGLRARGHRVVLAVNPAWFPLARQAGLEAVACGSMAGAAEARQPPLVYDETGRSLAEQKKWEMTLWDVPRRFRDLHAACAGADLLVAHSFHYAALLVHDQLTLPWVCVSLLPSQYQHEDVAATAQPSPRAELNLLASSSIFSKPDLELYPYLAQTGFWFTATNCAAEWQPGPTEQVFVEGGTPPYVLCLGSLPRADATQLLALHTEAVRRLGRRLVALTGWTEVPAADTADVLHRDFLAHDWLFPRAAAVIHPGGIGVTGRALRYGCPTLLEPFRADHYFHARLVQQLGTGLAANLARLTVNGLARLLAERVDSAEVRAQAQAVAARLAAEDGIGRACALIHDFLEAQQPRAT
jgi:UDP:flavonoid glycosyltransferase YjiC (YdhE family)